MSSVVERPVADTEIYTSTKDRLQALEQLAVTMYGDAIQTRTAAARADQRAVDARARVLGARSEGVEDARSLGKPRSLDDAADNCRQSKFTFTDYAGAVDARLEQAMTGSAMLQGSALMDSILAVGDLLISTQLHYALVPLLERSAQRLPECAGDNGEGSLSWHSLVG